MSGLRGAPADVVETEVSLRRAGVLLAESFLSDPVSKAMADVLRRAEAEHVPVRVGVAAEGLTWLPWEALSDPVSGRPLALQPLMTVYRRLTAASVRAVPGPLRIVVTIAAPDTGGGPVLDTSGNCAMCSRRCAAPGPVMRRCMWCPSPRLRRSARR